MSQKEPTTLALYDEEGLFLQWPKLLEKLSLGDGLQYFLEWKAQLFDFVEICGLQFHEFPMEEYLECHLFEVLMDQDLNFETFVQELHEIFQEFNDEEDKEAKDLANAHIADHAQSDWNLETTNLEEEKKVEIRNILEDEIEEEIDVEVQNQTKVVSGYLANDEGTKEAHKVIAIIQASQSQGSFQTDHISKDKIDAQKQVEISMVLDMQKVNANNIHAATQWPPMNFKITSKSTKFKLYNIEIPMLIHTATQWPPMNHAKLPEVMTPSSYPGKEEEMVMPNMLSISCPIQETWCLILNRYLMSISF